MKRMKLWTIAAIFSCGMVITSCTDDDSIQPSPEEQVEEFLEKMTIREKVGQMFFVRPESLDTTIHWIDPTDLMPIQLQQVNARMKGVNEKYPVGGIILYACNIEDEAQLARFLPQLKALNGQPLMCIDEEGGRVSRIANNPNFHVKKYESWLLLALRAIPPMPMSVATPLAPI